MQMQIGDTVKGVMAKNYPTGEKDSKGFPTTERKEKQIEGKIKSIDPDLYWSVEVAISKDESEWFHRSSLTVTSKPF